MFDLDELDTKTKAETGVPMAIKKLDGTPMLNKAGKPVTITVRGIDSDAHRAAMSRALSQIKGETQSDEEASQRAAERGLDILVACTVGWAGVIDKDGKPVEAKPENFRALYAGFPVIRDQVDRFIGDRANFLLASSKS